LRLANVLFFDEIHPDENPGLYAQCHVGLVALDHRQVSQYSGQLSDLHA
jgi:hypothetical protein